MARIGFIGCHEISWHCLKKICDLAKIHNDEVLVSFNLNYEEAKKHSAWINFDNLQKLYGFDLHYVSNIVDPKNIQLLTNYNLDVLFIIGWHRIVPQEVLNTGKIQLGIHSSLLPKDRGPSPINWQIIRGDISGAVTLFHLADDVDSGNIVDSETFSIDIDDDVRTVYSKATKNSLILLEKYWPNISNMNIQSISQNDSDATFNERRKPSDGKINWNQNSKKCYDWIRALTHPYPGAFANWKGKKIFLWTSKIINMKETKPGQILIEDEKLLVSTNNEYVEILSLQADNEPICDASLFIESYGIKSGEYFT